MAQKEEKMIVDKLRPTAEMQEAPKVDVKLEEEVFLGDCVADLLKKEGVEYVPYLTGGGTATMIAHIQKAGIKCVHVRHEQTAGFFLDGWGRLTAKPGFALPGAGTGLTNFSTGLCQTYCSGAPAVALQAESGPFDDDKYGGQSIARAENQFKGMTKWVRKVNFPNTLLWQLKRAFRSAMTPPTGPAVVAYGNSAITPGMRVKRKVAYQTYMGGYYGSFGPDPDLLQVSPDPVRVERAMKWLLEAEKPVIIAGSEAHQDQCQEELRELVHLLGIPAAGRRTARGIISELDPLCYGRRARGPLFREADRCIMLGLRCGMLERYGNAPFLPHKIRYCQINSCPDTTELNLPTDIEIIGNLKKTVRMMIDCAKDMGIKGPVEKWAKWRQFLIDTTESYRRRTAGRTDAMMHQTPVHPDLVGRLVADTLARDYNNNYISIIDGYTASSYFTAWNVATQSGYSLDASETIGIGHSPGMALACGLATKREIPIFAIMGDGAVGAAGMDIESCVRWDIPCVFLHENNNTLINGSWEYYWSKACAVEGNILHDSWETMPDIHYEKMAEAFGAHTEFVDKPEQLEPAIKRSFEVAMREKKPAFIEVFVDMDVIHSNFAQPAALVRTARQFNWDELPDKGQKLVATQLVSPAALRMLPKNWVDGIAAYQKK